MPLRYSTPGAYVESFDTDPQRIRRRRTDVTGFVGITERGPMHVPVKIQTWRQFESTFGGPVPDAYLAYAVNGFFQNGGRTCWVVRAGDPDQSVAASVCVAAPGAGTFVLAAASPGAWGNDLVVSAAWERDRVAALVVDHPDGRRETVRLPDAPARPEALGATGQPTSPPAARVQTNLLGVTDSALQELDDHPMVTIDLAPRGTRGQPIGQARRLQFSGGRDGNGAVRLEHLLGDETSAASPMGLAVLERIDGISIVAIPDLMRGQETAAPGGERVPSYDVRAAHEALVASCLRSRDRMALLDFPPRTTPVMAVEYAGSLQGTSIAAAYYPWIMVDDALRLRGPVRAVPASGHVAGMFARVDRRRGVHKPPANEPLEGAYDTLQPVDAAAHGSLNDAGVNAIRAVAGRGILVLGARTMDPDVTWRYVNVRRLFLMIEETLDEELQSLVFEPNNPQLWRDVRRTVGGFLDGLWRAGMLDGATADDAYTVRCDETTNPPWETAQGRVTCTVGLQPPYPAEFVIVRVGIARDGVEVRSDEVRDV